VAMSVLGVVVGHSECRLIVNGATTLSFRGLCTALRFRVDATRLKASSAITVLVLTVRVKPNRKHFKT
jgi:hypothetical protein